MNIIHSRLTAVFLSGLLLAACGGGTNPSGSNPRANKPPTASIALPNGMPTPAVDLSRFTLSANANDSDNDTLAFTWTQTAGPAVRLMEEDGAKLDIQLPLVAVETAFEFQVTVDDGHGGQATDKIAFDVRPGKMLILSASIDNPDVAELYRLHETDAAPVKLHEDVTAELSESDVDNVLLTPDRRHVIYLTDRDGDERDEVRIASTDGSGDVAASAPFLDADTGPESLSPTGRYYALFSQYGEESTSSVRIIDVENPSEPPLNLGLLDLGAGEPAEALRVFDYEWSPAGDSIAFTRKPSASEPFALFVLDMTDGSVRQVSETAVDSNNFINQIAWSPNATWLAYAGHVRDDDIHYYIAPSNPANGESNRRLSAGTYSRFTSVIEWSPDSKRIAFAASEDIASETDRRLYIADASAADESQPARFGATSGDITWSPDSKRIAFRTYIPALSRTEASVVDLSVDPPAVFTVSGAITDAPGVSGVLEFRWSPDGEHLAMQVERDANNAYVLLVSSFKEGADPTQPVEVSPPVTGTEGYRGFEEFAWSPAGNRIAFTGSPISLFGTSHLYVTPANATSSADTLRLFPDTDTNGDVGAFQWTPDESALIVSASADIAEDDRYQLFSVPVNGAAGEFSTLVDPGKANSWVYLETLSGY